MSKRRVKKRAVKIFTTLTIIILGTISFFYCYKLANKNKVNINVKNPQVEKWPKQYKLSFLATGDGLLHNPLVRYADNGDGTYDFKKYFTEIDDIVKSYDIAYYNQETVFAGPSKKYGMFPMFNTPYEYGDTMVDLGFNTISLATNHSMDMRESGALNTIKYWKEKKNILTNGMARSEEERTNYQIVEKNNIKYGLLSYTYGTNGLPIPKDKPYLVNLYNNELAKKDIEALRDKVDVLMVAMHWGYEYNLYPSEIQKEQAKYLSSLGVDIILGNHTHCIQPIEWIDDTLVIYSMGNFISNQMDILNKYGYKVVIGAFVTGDFVKTVHKDKTSDIKIENLEVDLLYNHKDPVNKTYKVVPFSRMDERFYDKYLNKDNYLKIYNEFKDVIQKYDKNIYVKPAK